MVVAINIISIQSVKLNIIISNHPRVELMSVKMFGSSMLFVLISYSTTLGPRMNQKCLPANSVSALNILNSSSIYTLISRYFPFKCLAMYIISELGQLFLLPVVFVTIVHSGG